ncbi:small subunit ribosomal protein S29, partial [Phenoliferia sp. Uapishka_3]
MTALKVNSSGAAALSVRLASPTPLDVSIAAEVGGIRGTAKRRRGVEVEGRTRESEWRLRTWITAELRAPQLTARLSKAALSPRDLGTTLTMSCCRMHTALRWNLSPLALPRGTLRSSHRHFSASTSSSAPPPKGVAKKISPYAKNKRGAGDDDASSGQGLQGLGNVLSEVTLPPADFSHIPFFQPEGITAAAVGQVQAFSPPTLAAFKALTIPGPIQKEFACTAKPSTVVRSATLAFTDMLDKSKTGSSSASRHLLAGPSGSGKSVLLLQGASHALSSGWVVLYLPSTAPLVDSSTPHAYSAPQKIFQQPVLAQQLLSRFSAANKVAFKKLKTQQARIFGDRSVAAGASLEELVRNVDDKTSTPVLEALFDDLAKQSEVPVLLALDNAQGLFTISSYVDPSYAPLEPTSLSVPRLLLEFVSGVKSFASGSIVLAPSLLSARKSLAMIELLNPNAKRTTAPGDVYSAILSQLQVMKVPARLERKEAVGIVHMLQSWRGTREAVSDDSFMEQYVGSDGNARQFSRSLDRNQQQ